ncbi:hypothetical protein CEXT_110941 [Caerostris extrusa]|uniref:Uncharacterized protein n=1 Tax=Caerostris extrusa TaxID=172846 RepID=A0AAV4P4D4_CAEEX|nr:hypothetical protein CEXT_110941 [Caerostris extrusa]
MGPEFVCRFSVRRNHGAWFFFRKGCSQTKSFWSPGNSDRKPFVKIKIPVPSLETSRIDTFVAKSKFLTFKQHERPQSREKNGALFFQFLQHQDKKHHTTQEISSLWFSPQHIFGKRRPCRS